MKPFVAIIGKANVGKSTFFNKVSGERRSIVLNTPGVTRDRLYADAEWRGRAFTLIDTGGIQLGKDDAMLSHIKKQAEIAIDIAEVILFFVDVREELTAEDYAVAELLRRTNKKVILVANKADNPLKADVSDFYSLGYSDIFVISAEHKLGLGDLLDEVITAFDIKEYEESTGLKIAFVGKPNAGKSSMVNKILGFERAIVSEVAGTTRDSIDTPFSLNGKDYIMIDTAGMRRKRSVEDNTVESYSVMRSLAAIRRADVVVLVLDATEEFSEQDVKIAGYVDEQGKPIVIVLNKWDLIEKDAYTADKFRKKIDADLAFMSYYKSLTASALTGQRLNKLMEMVDYVYEKAGFRVTTGLLNDVLADIMSAVEPPSMKGKRLKVRYATQASTYPPTFIIFVNDPLLMHASYKGYLENSLRKAFSLDGTPIRLIIRGKDEND